MSEIEQVIKRLETNNSLLDVMIEIIDFFESLDMFAYKNWIDGDIVDGPWVEKYWVRISFKYPYKKMPDPRAGLRLVKYGCIVSYKEMDEQVPKPRPSYTKNPGADHAPFDEHGRPKMLTTKVWIVNVKIPKRLVTSINLQDLEDMGVDFDDFVQGKEQGMDQNTPFKPQEPAATPAPDANSIPDFGAAPPQPGVPQ